MLLLAQPLHRLLLQPLSLLLLPQSLQTLLFKQKLQKKILPELLYHDRINDFYYPADKLGIDQRLNDNIVVYNCYDINDDIINYIPKQGFYNLQHSNAFPLHDSTKLMLIYNKFGITIIYHQNKYYDCDNVPNYLISNIFYDEKDADRKYTLEYFFEILGLGYQVEKQIELNLKTNSYLRLKTDIYLGLDAVKTITSNSPLAKENCPISLKTNNNKIILHSRNEEDLKLLYQLFKVDNLIDLQNKFIYDENLLNFEKPKLIGEQFYNFNIYKIAENNELIDKYITPFRIAEHKDYVDMIFMRLWFSQKINADIYQKVKELKMLEKNKEVKIYSPEKDKEVKIYKPDENANSSDILTSMKKMDSEINEFFITYKNKDQKEQLEYLYNLLNYFRFEIKRNLRYIDN